MHLEILYSVLFTLFCFLFLLVVLKPSNSKKSLKRLPPGPWKLPLIGNVPQFLGSHSLPHHTLRDLASKYGPLMHLQLGEISNIVVSSPEIAEEIMKTHDVTFANRPHLLPAKIFTYNFSDIGFSPYGAYWWQLRKICSVELLSPKRVQSFRFIREEEMSALMSTISAKEGSVVNLSKEIISLSNSITARTAFGKKSKDQETFISSFQEALKLASGFSIADLYPSIKVLPRITGMEAKVERLHRELDRVLENIIRDHQEKNRNGEEAEEKDIVDVLLMTQPQNGISYNIKAIILDIFIGGTETAAATVEWAMSELLKNPKVMEEAQAEVRRVFDGKGYVDETGLHQLKFLKSVIKETLRLHPPLPLSLPRENSESCEINGYHIPAKTRVIVNTWAIGRDPKYWSEAERFQPERFLDNLTDYNFSGTNFEYIPFGAGRRICPGIAFATPIFELPLANLLYHFDWKLPNGLKHEELDMTESFGATVQRKESLYLIPVRRHH